MKELVPPHGHHCLW